LRAFDRTTILDQVVRKARVKRLRQPSPTQFRLRAGEFRVFYDVVEEAVLIIQILNKQDCAGFLGGPS
jgi:mRNA-degrading endonuclease RelE of RelBE toxin-antitoxin system